MATSSEQYVLGALLEWLRLMLVQFILWGQDSASKSEHESAEPSEAELTSLQMWRS